MSDARQQDNSAHYKGNLVPKKLPVDFYGQTDHRQTAILKIHLESGDKNQNIILGYDAGSVSINHETYTSSLIVCPDTIVENWGPAAITALGNEHLQSLLELKPEVILIGSGQSLIFPPAEILRPLVEAGLGYEVMDTGAACRTYNILMAEGRRVVAGLIVPSGI